MIRFSSALSGSLTSDSNVMVFAFEKAKRPEGAFLFGSSVESALGTAREDGFKGRLAEAALVRPRDKRFARYIVVGLGNENDVQLDHLRRAAAAAARRAISWGLRSLDIGPAIVGSSPAVAAQAIAEGFLLGSYRYTEFKTAKDEKAPLQSVRLIAKDASERSSFDEGLRSGSVFAESVCFARDLINRPPSDTTPEALVKVVRRLNGARVSMKVFNKTQLERMGMGALLGVNRGSHQPPFFVHLIYRPGGRIKRRIGICGKGITFDSGGLSLKPAQSMETMKYDMSGAATVFAVFKALKELKPGVEVHGFTPLTENMPGGNALKPGDVLRTYHGKTIEVLNTDAEGRLVLSDALSYACRQPLDEVVDVATLTGACVIALGNQIAGLLGNNVRLMERIKGAAVQAGEKMWELPLEKEYEALIKSAVADVKNIGPVGEAGTIIGGLFLKQFVDDSMPWAHIDIASTGWTRSQTPLSEPGATGVMIRTLLHYILSYN